MEYGSTFNRHNEMFAAQCLRTIPYFSMSLCCFVLCFLFRLYFFFPFRETALQRPLMIIIIYEFRWHNSSVTRCFWWDFKISIILLWMEKKSDGVKSLKFIIKYKLYCRVKTTLPVNYGHLVWWAERKRGKRQKERKKGETAMKSD